MPLDIVPTAPPPVGWTLAELESLPDGDVRHELVDGVPRALPLPRLRHQIAARRLQDRVEAAAPPGVVAIGGVGVALDTDQLVLPDLVAMLDDPDRDEVGAADVLMIGEVVDPWSRSDDRYRKPGQYARAGIPVYLRVELDPPHVVAYGLGPDGLYRETARAEPGQQLRLTEPFAITLDPADLLR